MCALITPLTIQLQSPNPEVSIFLPYFHQEHYPAYPMFGKFSNNAVLDIR